MRAFLVLWAGLLALVVGAAAQTAHAVEPVDHYILALSWSPTYCADKRPDEEPLQCGLDADRRFVVHGLWPNTANGSPDFCRSRVRRPSRSVTRQMLDLMPDRGLIAHQWRKHGTCSGMDPADYFDTVRRAYERVSIPAGLSTLDRTIAARPEVLREAFMRTNPDLPEDGIYLRCRGDDLVDVRICLSPDLGFVECPRVSSRRCRSDQLTLDPPR